MTLAGNMKLRNFILLVVAACAAGSAGLWVACSKSGGSHDEPAKLADQRPAPPVAAPVATPPPAPASTPTPPPATSDLAARPYDEIVLGWQGKQVPGGKAKDVTHGKPYKIDIYQDAGKPSANRAKVDANRNGKWDDKFTFDGDKITLQRAPADDESYTETYHWNGSGWTKAR